MAVSVGNRPTWLLLFGICRELAGKQIFGEATPATPRRKPGRGIAQPGVHGRTRTTNVRALATWAVYGSASTPPTPCESLLWSPVRQAAAKSRPRARSAAALCFLPTPHTLIFSL